MAIAPQKTPPPAVRPAQAAEKTMLEVVSYVEAVVDSWLSHKDRTVKQSVGLPRMITAKGTKLELDAPTIAEIERRYVAAGWGTAKIEGNTLELTPPGEPPLPPAPAATTE